MVVNAFDPETVVVPVSGSVVWYNNEGSEHTVIAYEDEIPDEATYFASGGHESEDEARTRSPTGRLRQGDTYGHTFEVPGEYEYFCKPHEEVMAGTVIVEE